MRWLKRNPLNGIAIGILLFLALITWILIQVDTLQPGHAPTGGTVQGTPTVNTTAVVQDQLKQQDDKLQRDNSFPWIILNAVGSSIGTILVAGAALIAAWLGWRQWLTNRKDEQKKREEEQEQRREDQLSEQKKRAEERFQKVVEGFGGDNEGAKIGAAILLRTFLRPDYEQFYTQTFDLAVANLRLSRMPRLLDDPDGLSHPPEDLDIPLALTTLSQALIVVFKEAFPLARSQNKRGTQSLDATGTKLDYAYLSEADLEDAWMPQASLRKAILLRARLTRANLKDALLSRADLTGADLSRAELNRADLTGADLTGADLTGANLSNATLTGANLRDAKLTQAILFRATLNETNLSNTTLTETNLTGANLARANLSNATLARATLARAILVVATFTGADLTGADLSRAELNRATLTGADLTGATLTDANLKNVDLTSATLMGTNLRGVKGLTIEQLEAYKAKGAIIDEDPTASSSQLAVSPSPSSQDNYIKAPSAPSVQVGLLTTDLETKNTLGDGSNTGSDQ